MTYVTVNTHQAKLTCAMLLDAGLGFDVTLTALTHGGRMFRVSTDPKHQRALSAIYAAVLRRTDNT